MNATNKTIISNLSFLRAKLARMELGGALLLPCVSDFCPSWVGCPKGWDFETFSFYNKKEVATARLELVTAMARHIAGERAYYRALAKAKTLEARLGFSPSDFEIGLVLA